jgi:hypothetical protein
MKNREQIVFIKFELEEIKILDEIDSFSRGHITLKGKHGIISSKNTKINQSVMIFISLFR